MNIQKNISLAPFTSFGVGGPAESYIEIQDMKELDELNDLYNQQIWILGDGTNSLISDSGLPGLTIAMRNTGIEIDDTKVTAKSGTDWDELVCFAIEKNLWGIELMSGIPGNVGAAVAGNIAAYGQAVADSLISITVFDTKTQQTRDLDKNELGLSYRHSKFHTPEFEKLIITGATFNLSESMTQKLKYHSALSVAGDSGLNPDDLNQRREIIIKARAKAGSLLDKSKERTAGSFYKNPLLTPEVAEHVMSFEENDVPKHHIANQNKLHSGDDIRVSAAHVLLAAGFKRGQQWGQVQLHPDHVLKIVNLGGATAQDIFNVNLLIISTVKEKLGIDLEPEVKFLGKF